MSSPRELGSTEEMGARRRHAKKEAKPTFMRLIMLVLLTVVVAAGAALAAPCSSCSCDKRPPTRTAAPSPAPSPKPAPEAPDSNARLQADAAAFRALRRVKGHFAGEAWNPDVDAWNGRKHQVMNALADALGHGPHTADEVVALLGPPDEVLGPDSPYWQHDREIPPDASRLLAYHWRGRHDFLYFVCVKNRVVAARWFMALE